MLIDFLLNNIFLFQQASVVPIFEKISLLLVLFLVLAPLLGFILQRLIGGPDKRTVQIVFYPFFVIGMFFLLSYVILPFMGLDYSKLSVGAIFEVIISYWYFFIIFPLLSILFKLPFKFLLKENKYFQTAIIPSMFEELSYRFFLINSLFLVTNSLEVSIFVGILIFSLGHLFQQIKQGLSGWAGLFAINNTIIGGIIYVVVAVHYGLIFAVIIHLLNNVIALMTVMGELQE
ncbi:MAG: CPBP family glutamic-type intramembrane protease [archaeon]